MCIRDSVGALVQERARTDSRIRYRKLDSNEGIAGNTNQGFALAIGEYIALLDHDDILHPCALWYVCLLYTSHHTLNEARCGTSGSGLCT